MPTYRLSDHYDGQSFHNLDPSARSSKGLRQLIKWKLDSKAEAWPGELVEDNVTAQVASPLGDEECRVTHINHASVLVQWSGVNLLTDPVFSEKLGPLAFLNLKRYRKPGLSLREMPKIDFVFISHNHYDHLDAPSLAAMDARDKPTYIVPLGVSAYLPPTMRERVHELDWWDAYSDAATGFVATLTPAQHWSKRTPFDTNRSLWGGGYFKRGDQRVFFAGDTGYAAHFSAIAAKLGSPDISLLPIGAYEPRWFMKQNHMNPADAVQAHIDLGSRFSVAVHFGTFRLTDEAIDRPEVDLGHALDEARVAREHFVAPKNGQSFLSPRR